MSFVIKDDDVLDKYDEIWHKIKGELTINFRSMALYDEKYLLIFIRYLFRRAKIKIKENKDDQIHKH